MAFDRQRGWLFLIGGAPGAGKTTTARALARRMSIDRIPFDDVTHAVRAATTVETHPPFHQMRDHNPMRYFAESDPKLLIDDAADLEAATWPMIERIANMRRADHSAVLDWWLVSPATVAASAIPNLAAAWIHIDPAELERRERSSAWEFYESAPDPEQMFAGWMERSIWANDRYAAEARASGLPVIEQTGELSVDVIVDALLERFGWGSNS